MSTENNLCDDAVVIQETKQIIANHPQRTGQLLSVLNDVQEKFRYLPQPALNVIQEELGVSQKLLEFFGTFFDDLSLDPVGRYIIQVCNGTACHTLGSMRLLAKFEDLLGIHDGETTPDGRITLKTVNCVGACGIAPVVIGDGEVYGRVGITRVADIVSAVKNIDDVARGAAKQAENTASAPKAETELELAPSGNTPMKCLASLASAATASLGSWQTRIAVGLATCGRAAGAEAIYSILEHDLADESASIQLAPVGCKGLCSYEPLVEVETAEASSAMYGLVDEECAHAIAALACGTPTDKQKALLDEHRLDADILAPEERRVLANCGAINPHSLAEYLARCGYAALAKALEESSASAIIDEIESAGLRGRGGAGFSTGKKWRSCASAPVNESANPTEPARYFIVNADEGDPGAYMDRGLLESDPHRVLEGLIIGAYAIGAPRGYFFIRAEYPLAVKTVQEAIDAAYAAGLLGKNILGSEFSFDVSIVRGAGAFLNGESTAMANVLENKRCFPRVKPPHLTESGLWGKPTCLNNVETLANVPGIVEHGAGWFRSVGTEMSPGTKVFSVTGSVERSGLVEVPLGITLGELVENVAHATNPKAVQVGGPSGEFIPAAMENLEVSFEGLKSVDGMMGSGGFVVLSQEQCVVDTALYLTKFCASQSCRKERECPDGMDEAAELLEKITKGKGTREDVARIEELALRNREVTHCGLGRTGLNPALSSIRYFPEEYEAHLNKTCPGLVCKDLVSYVIDTSKCKGERCCLTTCPGNAIKGSFGKPGRIVPRLCQKCGMCVVSCCYGAVHKVSPAVTR